MSNEYHWAICTEKSSLYFYAFMRSEIANFMRWNSSQNAFLRKPVEASRKKEIFFIVHLSEHGKHLYATVQMPLLREP